MPPSDDQKHRIGWAVKQLKAGRTVTRQGWKVKGQRISYVPAEAPGEGTKAEAYLLLTTKSGRCWPVTLGQQDILAEDYCYAE